MSTPVEFGDKKLVSYGLMVKTVIVVAFSVFAATMIWNRFLFMENELTIIKKRMDTRYARQQEYNKTIKEMILPLQVTITQED